MKKCTQPFKVDGRVGGVAIVVNRNFPKGVQYVSVLNKFDTGSDHLLMREIRKTKP